MALVVTALYGSIWGLLFAAMSLFIGLSRAGSGVMHGTTKNGKEDTLFASRMRVRPSCSGILLTLKGFGHQLSVQ